MSRVIERNLWLYKMGPQTLKHVTNKIQSFYFGEETQYDKVPMLVLKLFSDMWTCEWQQIADYQAEVAPVYLFFFIYVGELNYQKLFFIRMLCSEEVSQELGTCHADDSCYLTNYNKIVRHMKKIPAPFNQDVIKVINNMAKICTNFAKNGNPNGGLSENVEWRAHTQRDPCYLKFDLNLEVINGIINEDRAQFWKDLINYIKEHEQCNNTADHDYNIIK